MVRERRDARIFTNRSESTWKKMQSCKQLWVATQQQCENVTEVNLCAKWNIYVFCVVHCATIVLQKSTKCTLLKLMLCFSCIYVSSPAGVVLLDCWHKCKETYSTETAITVFLMMNPWGSKHVDDVKNRNKTLI